jgi:putative glycerol-1-phosphate prenyltransferase
MTNKIYRHITDRKAKGIKSFTLLIDPDKFDESVCQKLLVLDAFSKVDFIFVGGSLIQGININQTIQLLKTHTEIPIIIFPGSNMHIDMSADGILFLSLISGRNPDFLIGQHIVAAPILKKSRLEILSTGYMLVEGGKQTTASYMSNTTPLPYDKPEVAVCTAMAGELLGLKLIYADTGSGAEKAVSLRMVNMLSKSLNIPLIIGGGIKTAVQAQEILEAGADMIVIGNAIEDNPTLLDEVYKKVKNLNERNSQGD